MNKERFMLPWCLVCLVSFLMVIEPDENARVFLIVYDYSNVAYIISIREFMADLYLRLKLL